MKIHLTQENGIQILTILGAIDAHGSQILRAGISKLLKNGHNRIILELLNPDQVEEAGFREITVLHKLATDLLGDLIIAGVSDKKAVIKAPELTFYPNRVTALSHFAPKPADGSRPPGPVAVPIAAASASPTATPTPLTGTASIEALQALIEDQKKIIAELKNQILSKGPDASSQEISTLREENQALKARLEELIIYRRTPQSNEAVIEKMNTLEAEILKLNGQLREAGPKKPN